MAKMEHFAIYAADAPALKDFYVAAFGLRVILESGGNPPAYFLADDAGMALEIIGRPEGGPGVNQRLGLSHRAGGRRLRGDPRCASGGGLSSRPTRSSRTPRSGRPSSMTRQGTVVRLPGGTRRWCNETRSRRDLYQADRLSAGTSPRHSIRYLFSRANSSIAALDWGTSIREVSR